MAFDTLHQLLMHDPILAYPDFSEPFTLSCDASKIGLWAIISQKIKGRDRTIAYPSRLLTSPEKMIQQRNYKF